MVYPTCTGGGIICVECTNEWMVQSVDGICECVSGTVCGGGMVCIP